MDVQEFLAWEKTTRDTIDFKKVYVDIAGDIVAGLALSEIVFWHLPSSQSGQTKLRVHKVGHLWIARARHEWWERTRITPKQVDRVLTILVDKGLIVKKNFKFNGSPTTHIRIVWETFLEQLQAVVHQPVPSPYGSSATESGKSISPIEENPDSPTGELHLAESGESITETTAETTGREENSKGHAPDGTRPPATGNTLEHAVRSTARRQNEQSTRHREKLSDGGKDLEQGKSIEDKPEYTPFEVWLLAACHNTKKLTDNQRRLFHRAVTYLDDERKAVPSPTVNQAWDSDPAYQVFVRDVILLDIQSKRLAHPSGFDNWLNAPKTWERFYAWRKAHGDEYDPTSARDEEEGRLVVMPDGVEIWVPYAKDITEAIREYLSSLPD